MDTEKEQQNQRDYVKESVEIKKEADNLLNLVRKYIASSRAATKKLQGTKAMLYKKAEDQKREEEQRKEELKAQEIKTISLLQTSLVRKIGN